MWALNLKGYKRHVFYSGMYIVFKKTVRKEEVFRINHQRRTMKLRIQTLFVWAFLVHEAYTGKLTELNSDSEVELVTKTRSK